MLNNRFLKKTVAIALLMFQPTYFAFAVHKGAGSLDCSGCHTMHNSQNNASMGGSPSNYLIRGTNTENLCLSCHDTAGSQYPTYSATVPAVKGTPVGLPASGNFSDLDTVTGDAPNTANQGRGHNLGATAALMPAGGDTTITGFNCANCHDPHGVAATGGGIASYRNLKLTPTGSGTTAGGVPADIRALPAQGTLASAVFPITANSYGTAGAGPSNLSQWCGTCHDAFYGSGNTNAATPYIRHPTDKALGAAHWANYSSVAELNRYPAEDTLASLTANSGNLNNKSAGNEANDGVFCLSCHKPHASANKDALRWTYETTGQGDLNSVSGCGRCHNK